VTRDPEHQECSRVRHSKARPYSGDPEVRSSRPQTSRDGLRVPGPRASRCSNGHEWPTSYCVQLYVDGGGLPLVLDTDRRTV
jgi:hypothetical protein